jgi:predicted P-loop ATPase
MRIRRKWEVTTTSDYREAAKPTTGYRGLHIVALRRERLVEIQLRTEREQYWAEVVERTSSRTGFALKDGEGPPSLLRYFEVASTLGWQDEYELPVDRALLDELAALREQVRPYFSSNPAADV